jgi:hypothetical protein
VATSSSTPSAQGNFVFEGIGLGMSKQEVLAVLKAKKATKINSFPQGFDFEMGAFSFQQVRFNQKGFVNNYVVIGLSQKIKSGSKSGPLFDAAVKRFGPPTNYQNGVNWKHNDGSYAIYTWDADEAPTGNLAVFDVKAL